VWCGLSGLFGGGRLAWLGLEMCAGLRALRVELSSLLRAGGESSRGGSESGPPRSWEVSSSAVSEAGRWVLRLAGRREPSPQEREVAGLIKGLGLVFEQNRLFEVGGRAFLVDFFLPGVGAVLECTLCGEGGGKAVSELLKRCSYFDYKFRRIRSAGSELVCAVLAEAPLASPERVRAALSDFENIDLILTTLGELSCFLRGFLLCRGRVDPKPAGGGDSR